MSDTTPAILLFRGRGVISRLIRWQTRSCYSHAAIRTRDGTIVEAWQFAGVRRKRLKDCSNIDAFTIVGCTDEQWDKVIKLAEAQIGCRYDYRSVFRFVSRRAAHWNRRWFCSELVYAAVKYAGLELLGRVKPHDVSPALLSMSPMLVRID